MVAATPLRQGILSNFTMAAEACALLVSLDLQGHVHSATCGHTRVEHDGHLDYLVSNGKPANLLSGAQGHCLVAGPFRCCRGLGTL